MTLVCLVVGTDAEARAIVEGAVRRAFPGAVPLSFDTLESAPPGQMPSGMELLAMANPDAAAVAKAAAALDANGLPRWSIVACGAVAAPEEVEIVPCELWNEPFLVCAMRRAVVQHRLRRENARLRGDLRSIGRRIVHDLRVPLGAISITGEVLKEELAVYDPSCAALVKPLFDSLHDMNKLLDNVSMIAKASANPVAKVPVVMGEIVRDVLQGLERRILNKRARVVVPESWPNVDGVSAWLEFVWANLLANALDHGGNAVRIELGWNHVGSDYKFWLLNRDGKVSESKLSTLFQPFHLLHQPNARQGLGLSVVQRLIELQNGTCGYELTDSNGSIFFFTLPSAGGHSVQSTKETGLD